MEIFWFQETLQVESVLWRFLDWYKLFAIYPIPDIKLQIPSIISDEIMFC